MKRTHTDAGTEVSESTFGVDFLMVLPTELILMILEMFHLQDNDIMIGVLKYVNRKSYTLITDFVTVRQINIRITCRCAAYQGYLSILQWIRSYEVECDAEDEEVCASAALNGQLQTLMWLRANGCKWDWMTCEDAAKNGHLELIQWARANGC